MPITLPPFVAPNELIESSWGNAVVNALDELDQEKLDLAGGIMSGGLNMNGNRVLNVADPQSPGDAVNRDFADNRYVNVTGDTMTGGIVVGGDPTAPAEGCSLSVGGLARTLTNTADQPNIGLDRRVSGAVVAGQPFENFRRIGVVIGSIAVANSTSVAYNTTSDERLKTVLRDVDDDEAAAILRAVAPVVYRWTEHPDDGEHIGFVAQQLAATWPTFVQAGIVTPGTGEPGDDDFVPWMVDMSKLAPLIVAGWQALDRRLAALEAR